MKTTVIYTGRTPVEIDIPEKSTVSVALAETKFQTDEGFLFVLKNRGTDQQRRFATNLDYVLAKGDIVVVNAIIYGSHGVTLDRPGYFKR